MLDRTPVALWWLVGLLLTGVGVLPLVGAETRTEVAAQEAHEAEGWVGTTVVVEGSFDRLDDVRDVRPGVQVADAVYVVDLPDGSTADVRRPARRDEGVLRDGLQPPSLLLRVPTDDAGQVAADRPVRAVEWGQRVQPAEKHARQQATAARTAERSADHLRVVTLALAAVVGLACVAATWRVGRRSPRRPGWFAGTRVPVAERGDEAVGRAATSGELPVAMALLAGLVAVAPPSLRPASLVLAGLVVLGAVALLTREREAVVRARSLPVHPRRRRHAVLARSLHAAGLVAGAGLAVAPVVDDHVVRGVGVAVLSAAVLLTAAWQRAPSEPARDRRLRPR